MFCLVSHTQNIRIHVNPKILVRFFNVIVEPIQYGEYLVSTVDTDGLVL